LRDADRKRARRLDRDCGELIVEFCLVPGGGIEPWKLLIISKLLILLATKSLKSPESIPSGTT
jgi:hypothetical protein